MITMIEDLMCQLKQARQAKKMSQRFLGKQVHQPQSHIANIELGKINLRLTTFMEMARTLELEVMLIPRTSINLVQGWVAAQSKGISMDRPAYRLDSSDDEYEEDQ